MLSACSSPCGKEKIHQETGVNVSWVGVPGLGVKLFVCRVWVQGVWVLLMHTLNKSYIGPSISPLKEFRL